MNRTSGRSYTASFKREAVKLAKQIGPHKAAQKLGVSPGNLANWKLRVEAEEMGKPKAGSPEEELAKLRAENEELKKINEILKRAAAFFSQDHLK